MTIKKVIGFAINSLVGTIFIVSALAKLFPIELFEYTIVDTTFIGWKLSAFVARIIVAIELSLGIMLVFSYQASKTIKLTITVLIIFSIYLMVQFFGTKSNSDCGCMGQLLSLTPLQGLIKNILLIGLLVVAKQLLVDYRFNFRFITPLLFVLSILTIFIVNPIVWQSERTTIEKNPCYPNLIFCMM